MEQFIMKGGNPLVGEVTISGAKNAALGILAASILTDEDVLIENLPDVRDINVFLEAVSEIGAMVDRIDRHTVPVSYTHLTKAAAGTDGCLRQFLACMTKRKQYLFQVFLHISNQFLLSLHHTSSVSSQVQENLRCV